MNDTFSGPDEIRKILMTKRPQLQTLPGSGLSSGSTLLNLACTGTADSAFQKGKYYFFVGDSMSGKTWFTLTCLAEACRLKAFKDYSFYHDDVERGANMDLAYYFGARLTKRLEEPPNKTSTTVEEFYYNINEALDIGPCIYILDSMDALSCKADMEQFEKERKAHATGKEVTGSYGTGKSKANSEGLRHLMNRLQETESILIIISQTRDNIGFGAQFNPKTRSGGKALRFYAHCEIWTSVVKTLKKKVKGKDRQVGAVTRCDVKKNRSTGQQHKVEVPFMHSYGIDDMTSCVEYLIDEGHWKKNGSLINAEDIDFKGQMKPLLVHIEETGAEDIVREIVEEVWNEIQDSLRVKDRKRRYE